MKIKYLVLVIIGWFTFNDFANAQSNLFESVKRNPDEAIALCDQFRDMNSKGISASSSDAISQISNKKNLSQKDAEILSIYVIGLYCPDVN